MKKYILLAVASTALVCSCEQSKPIVASVEDVETAVMFDTYSSSVVTRSETWTLDKMKNSGFGVFAFDQQQMKLTDYSKLNYQPDFMYNQKVSFDKKGWTYEPVKYWPNNEGALVSFFAYAPYTDEFDDYVADADGKFVANQDTHTITPDSNTYLQTVTATKKTGLRLLLGYDHNGPGIEYTRPEDPREGVDLMWGALDGTNHCPYDLDKPKINEKIKFNFKHALSRLDFYVQVWDDAVSPDGKNNALAPNTTITIKSVTLKGNIASTGTLRLYDGSWSINKEDVGNVAFLRKDSADESDFTELVFSGLDGEEAVKKIPLLKSTESNIAKNNKDNYVTLIPGAKFYIEIVYDVKTVDEHNPKNTSVVTNTITSTTEKDKLYELVQGNAYTFNLMLGMTSVKFDATVTDWENVKSEENVDLPANHNEE